MGDAPEKKDEFAVLQQQLLEFVVEELARRAAVQEKEDPKLSETIARLIREQIDALVADRAAKFEGPDPEAFADRASEALKAQLPDLIDAQVRAAMAAEHGRLKAMAGKRSWWPIRRAESADSDEPPEDERDRTPEPPPIPLPGDTGPASPNGITGWLGFVGGLVIGVMLGLSAALLLPSGPATADNIADNSLAGDFNEVLDMPLENIVDGGAGNATETDDDAVAPLTPPNSPPNLPNNGPRPGANATEPANPGGGDAVTENAVAP